MVSGRSLSAPTVHKTIAYCAAYHVIDAGQYCPYMACPCRCVCQLQNDILYTTTEM